MMSRGAPLVAAAFGAYLLYASVSGRLYFYIHPIYIIPVVVTGVVLLAVAVLSGAGPRAATERAVPARLALALLAIPVAAGVLLPARPLGVSMAAQRGVDTLPLGRVDDAPEFSVSVRPETYTIKDWVRAQQADPEPGHHAGKPVRVTGFVYRDDRLPRDWFVVARFVVQCCAVDAQPIGLPVRVAVGELPAPGNWVTIAGSWDVADIQGERRAVIAPTSVTPTERPDQPYLY
jgi:putative membrane protein